MSRDARRNRETSLEFDMPRELKHQAYIDGYRDAHADRGRGRRRNVTAEMFDDGSGYSHRRHRGEEGCTCPGEGRAPSVNGCTCPEYEAEQQARSAGQMKGLLIVAAIIAALAALFGGGMRPAHGARELASEVGFA